MARVLVVEDDLDSRATVMAALARASHEVIGAADGNEALNTLLHDRADIVVLDVRLPFLDGARFMEILRSYVRWRAVPVVVVTAVPDGPELDRVVRHGIARVFRKATYRFTELLSAIDELTGTGTAAATAPS